MEERELSYSEVEEMLLSETPKGYLLEGFAYAGNENLKTFLKMFLEYRRREYPTVSNTSQQKPNVICKTGRLRSLGDIFLICVNYFPGVTLKKVKQTLDILIKEGICTYFICNNINKGVYAPMVFHRWAEKYKKEKIRNEFGWCLDSEIKD